MPKSFLVMKQVLAQLFLLIPVISLFGQNYQTVSSNRISYFEDEDYIVSCIRIDSVESEVDSVYILLPLFRRQKMVVIRLMLHHG